MISPNLGSMTFDTVTGVFSSVPTVGEISSSKYSLNVYTNDQYKADNGNWDITFKVYINPNRAPILNTAFQNFTYPAGSSLSFSFATDMFIDPEGEPLAYTKAYPVADPSSWLSYDISTRTFSGIPPVNSGVGEYIIEISANDNNTNSEPGQTNFTLIITENKIPELDQGLPSATPVVTFYEFSYTIPTDAFKDPEDDAISIRVELVPADFTVTYTPSDRTVRGTLTDNTKFGDFILKLHVEDIWNVSTFTYDLPIRINENLPPVVNFAAPDPS